MRITSSKKDLETIYYKDIFNPGRIITFLTIGAVASFFILCNMDIPSHYAIIRMEPIVYVVMLTIFVRARHLIGLGSITLVCMYFVKLCIVPITTILGDFTSIVASYIFSFYWDEGCFYIALEWTIVACSIRIFGTYYKDWRKNHSPIEKQRLSVRDHFFYYFIVLALSFTIIVLIGLNSSLITSIFFIWNLEDDTAASTGGPTWYMFKTFLEIVKPMIFFWIACLLTQSSIKHGKSFLLILLALIASVIMTEYRILSILTGLTILVYVIWKYGSSKMVGNGIKIGALILLVPSVIQMTTHGESLNQSLENMGRLFDIYCGGYIVAAASCSVKLEDGLLMFLHDTANGSFLLRHIWGTLYSTTDAINFALNSGAEGTFYELMVQCKDFFGVFSPFAVAACIWFIFLMDVKSRKEDIDLYKMFYIFCSMAIGFFMVMYTYSMVTNFIIFKCCVWILFIALDRRIKAKI